MIEGISFKILDNLEECKIAWQALTPDNNIYDNWDFRALFHKYHQKRLHFVAGYINNAELIGLLPLQFNDEVKYFEFFGGNYMEDNKVFIKPGFEDVISEFYKNINGPAKLEYITGNDSYTSQLPVQDYKFVLPLDGLKTYVDYLDKFVASHEQNKKMQKIVRRTEKEKIEIIKNNFSDIEILFDYNKQNFGGGSAFVDRPYQKEIFRDLLKLPHHVALLTFKVNDNVEAVSLAIIYKGVHEGFNTGITRNVTNLSAYVTLKKIQYAIDNGAHTFDAFVGDYGWKEKWGFLKIPQYIFSNLNK